MGNILTVQGLCKNYGELIAVSEVTFSIKEGEIYGLLGPNGAGKTTTLECIEGLKQYKGAIKINGYDLSTDKKQALQGLGVQMQVASLLETITVREAMRLFSPSKLLDPELLNTFGLETLLKKQYRTLSTGQKRRLHLAISLLRKPKLLILDEPTAGLDVEGRWGLHQVIKNLKKEGTAILLATHDMSEAQMLCDRVGILLNGTIKFEGTPNELTRQERGGSKIIIATKDNCLDRYTWNGEYHKESEYHTWITGDGVTTLQKLLTIIQNENDEVLDLRVEKPTLEERFLELVQGGDKNE